MLHDKDPQRELTCRDDAAQSEVATQHVLADNERVVHAGDQRGAQAIFGGVHIGAAVPALDRDELASRDTFAIVRP
jgi:hypothetical protein